MIHHLLGLAVLQRCRALQHQFEIARIAATLNGKNSSWVVLCYTEGTSFLHKAKSQWLSLCLRQALWPPLPHREQRRYLRYSRSLFVWELSHGMLRETFKLVFGFAVLGLILCVMGNVAPAGQTLFLLCHGRWFGARF